VEGRRALYPFLEAHGVAYRKCGKLLVAPDQNDIPAIEDYFRRAEHNGVEGARLLSGGEARALAPGLRAAAAVEFSESGILDAHGYMGALAGEIESLGGAIVRNSPFLGARVHGNGFDVRVGGEAPTSIDAPLLVISAGLAAQSCARAVEGYPQERVPKQYLAKGNYFALSGAKAPFSHLIYPPPIAGALGTHYRRDLGGIARFGPDLEWVAREDYRVDPSRAELFYAAVRKFWPDLPDGALTPDYAGIRPKIHGPGEPQPDFIIDDRGAHGLAGLVCLFGIESPGLTASLALGEEVAARLLG
jgi:L-2-hydroxyglutarate oxidase LhgO